MEEKVENNYEIHQVTKETKKTKDEDGLIPLKYEIIKDVKGCIAY